jgi:hypothetical protein
VGVVGSIVRKGGFDGGFVKPQVGEHALGKHEGSHRNEKIDVGVFPLSGRVVEPIGDRGAAQQDGRDPGLPERDDDLGCRCVQSGRGGNREYPVTSPKLRRCRPFPPPAFHLLYHRAFALGALTSSRAFGEDRRTREPSTTAVQRGVFARWGVSA